jgi:cell division septal protein FtsQ
MAAISAVQLRHIANAPMVAYLASIIAWAMIAISAPYRRIAKVAAQGK